MHGEGSLGKNGLNYAKKGLRWRRKGAQSVAKRMQSGDSAID